MPYGVKSVCERTGLTRSTLLAWERRHGVVHPERGDNGYRNYSHRDLERLSRVKSLVDQGLRVSDALEQVRRSEDAPDLEDLRPALLRALLTFTPESAHELADQAASHPPCAQVQRLYLPLLEDLDRARERGEASLAQTRYAHGFVRHRLLEMLEQPLPEARAGVAALLTPTGHPQELGLIAAGVHFVSEGWRVDWLGIELPVEELAGYCRDNTPDVVWVGLACPIEDEALESLCEGLREYVPQAHVLLGGPGVRPPRRSIGGCEVVPEVADLPGALRRLSATR